MSTIATDIVAWAAARPGWQQTLLVDLAAGAEIDEDRLMALLDTLLDPAEKKGTALREEDLPASGPSADPVLLRAVGPLENINALVAEQTLTFAEAGLTVIYGDNAAGKSGFARPLKAAVSSLHREPIHGDVFAADPTAAQSAAILYKRGSEDLDCAWPDNLAPDLSAVHFYDEACGDTYLQNESELSYRPSVLTLLDGLIVVCDELVKRIDVRLSENAAETKALPAPPEDSPAATFLASLSGATSDAEIDAAALLAPDSEQRHTEALSEEARLRTSDPAKEKLRLAARAADLRTAAARVETLTAALDEEALGALRGEIEACDGAREAAKLASQGSFEGEPLAGVGSETWQALWAAARAYSESEAYPEREFPATEDANCVLCQQPLAPGSADRLSRFEAFVRDDTARRLQSAESALTARKDALQVLAPAPAALTAALARLADSDSESAAVAEAWMQKFEDRRLASIALLAGTDPAPPIEDLPASPHQGLIAAADAHETAAASIDAAGFKAALEALVSEREEIEGRRLIAAARETIAEERDRRLARERLEAAKKRADTKSISRKIGDLIDVYVTTGVRDRFIRESDRLGLERIDLEKKSNVKGKVRHKPGLLDANSSQSVDEVLSEGEQTALGLAGFFTEAYFDSSASALVLDDPVSSLDHIRRDKVADRLVALAADRQVLVFTHDLEFVVSLSTAAQDQEGTFTERSIERRGGKKPGVCIDHHPWKAKDIGQRINDLDHLLAGLKKEREELPDEEYEKRCADWAGKLSETWERLLHLEIAMPLVRLPKAEVRPKMLKVISAVTDADDKQFQTSYSRVSKWARRHDKNPALNYVAPEPADLQTELDSIREFFDRVKKYKN